MKPVFVLCLLVATAAQADSHRIREVRFTGDLAFDPDALKKVLEELEGRTVETDMARLRSFYISHGYFDAHIAIGDVTYEGREATVTLDVTSGPRSRIRQVTIEGLTGRRAQSITSENGDFPVDALCKGLLDAARDAETHGRIDFGAELEVTGDDWVDVTARVRPGTAHAVGRINFSGHYRTNESTLRRMMVLRERSLFDVGKLRRSLAQLNRSGLVEPLSLEDVEIRPHADGVTVDLEIAVRERRRARWRLSGPLIPGAGSLQAAISSRLPAWGRGFFEASTYSVTLSLIGLANPLARLLPIASNAIPSMLFVVERPYLPGQAPFSGFVLSPQLSVRTMLTSYGLTHLGRGARMLLDSETLEGSGLLVPVQASADGEGRRPARFLICELPKPRLGWLRRGAAYAADAALATLLP